MFCKWCGKQVEDGVKFCPNCGKEILKDEKEVSYEKVDSQTEEKIESKTSGNQEAEAVNETNLTDNTASLDRLNVGYAILSFFIPLVGLVIFFTNKSKNKKMVNACGTCGLIGFILNIFVVFIIFVAFIIFHIAKENETIKENSKYDDTYSYDYNDNSNTSINWKNYVFTINGINLNLPCEYDDIKIKQVL